MLSYIPIRLQKVRCNMTSVTYRRKGCKYHKCSSHLQKGISWCLDFTRAKLCWTFINTQVLEKKLGHHSSSDYWTCSTEAPRSLLGVQSESAIFEKARHCEKRLIFFTCEISTVYVLLSVEVCVFLPLQWKLVNAQLYLDCKGLICSKAAEK